MFRSKTVLVIGAGASFEVGLPVGTTLLKTIVEMVDIRFSRYQQTQGSGPLYEALKLAVGSTSGDVLQPYIEAGAQLAKSARQAMSIDNVIDALEDRTVELMGKLGITQAILEAEGASPRFVLPDGSSASLDMTKFESTWYNSLSKLLTENVRKSEIDRIFDNVEIINFNYDRCLEHYLPYSLSEYYGVSLDKARSVVSTLRMHRPYGSVGLLPWQEKEGPKVDFGQPSPRAVAQVSGSIRTFTEQERNEEALQEIKRAISASDQVVFLGFGYHRQNVELLSNPVSFWAAVYGTAMQISESDRSVVQKELRVAFKMNPTQFRNQILLADMTCAQFFREHWRSLTAASQGGAATSRRR
ncbi:hypothetical protein [Devosia sp. LjRoot3]|uniref:hypothetical protein n=1 Tax=Devosia sp. LjRoot3 TaxID=3342319 RepID=UPI003ECF7EAE